MKIYVPQFLPGDIVAATNGETPKGVKRALVGVVQYCVYDENDGFEYVIDGWMGTWPGNRLTLCPPNRLDILNIK